MHVAVAGGTGVIGRLVVDEVTRSGDTPIVVARATGVDLTTGAGLDEALVDADVVIDVTNSGTMDGRRSTDFFSTAGRNLLDAAHRVGMRHHVLLSIVGVDRVDLGYYRAKLHQETLVQQGPVPATVLRSTQFFEFADQLLQRGRLVTPVPRMRSRPVAARDVARRLVEIARDTPAGRLPDLGGPAVHEMPDLVRAVARARGERRLVVPVRLPGAAGRAMARGALLPEGTSMCGETTFDAWLTDGGRPAEAEDLT